ncbi:MAG: nucleoside-triphosphatase, partial [Sphaerochaetaceae bacterium]
DYIVIDEIGPLELQQKGFHLLLEKLLSSFEKHLIVVTSNEHVDDIIKKYQLSTYNMIILESDKEWDKQMNRVLS